MKSTIQSESYGRTVKLTIRHKTNKHKLNLTFLLRKERIEFETFGMLDPPSIRRTSTTVLPVVEMKML